AGEGATRRGVVDVAGRQAVDLVVGDLHRGGACPGAGPRIDVADHQRVGAGPGVDVEGAGHVVEGALHRGGADDAAVGVHHRIAVGTGGEHNAGVVLAVPQRRIEPGRLGAHRDGADHRAGRVLDLYGRRVG